MKPLNIGSESCAPISSSCVIWQGPDITCINLCKGDTVNAVVYKLATELCALMEQFDISNYDLECLNLNCPPDNFQTLIQILIDKICALEDCCNQTPGTERLGCPDCVVDICEAFWYTSPTGDLIKTMQLTDYVKAIGNKVCTIVQQIATINATLVSYNIRITALENAPPPTFNLPEITPICVLPSTSTAMNLVLIALEQQFCALITATGTSTEIFTAITYQCPNLNVSPQLGGPGTMSAIPGWVNSVQNLADSITNLWLTICDLRAAVINIQENCCPSGCDGIDVGMTASLTGTDVRIYVTGTVPANFIACPPTGTATFTISDGTTTTTFTGPQGYDIIAYLNNPSGYSYALGSTALDLTQNLTITMTPCFFDPITQTTCQYQITYVILSMMPCPTLTLTATSTSVSYTGTVGGVGTATYAVEIYDVNPLPSGTLVNTNTVVLTAPSILSGTFTGLTPATQYKVRVVITSDTGTNTCPFSVITTASSTCPGPEDVVASVTITP